jgi:hypothetical protein
MALIFTSYSLNYIPPGAIIMLLHDITDLCMSVFKLTSDVTPFLVQLFFYLIMVIPWIYFRQWFFIFHVIVRAYEEYYLSPHYNVLSLSFLMCMWFLKILAVMHIFWLYIMIKGLIKRCLNNNFIALPSSENS